MNKELPQESIDAAWWWYKYGFNVVPIIPENKCPAVKWQPWLDTLSEESIIKHWKDFPQHEVGAIVDDLLFIIDADSDLAVDALSNIEKTFGLCPNLIVSTRKGEHHHFRRAPNTYAKARSFSTEKEPEKLDIRTGRGRTEGRSIIILPPSTNKSIKLKRAKDTSELIEVGQEFIDAIFKHNGDEAPRLRLARSNKECLHSKPAHTSNLDGYVTNSPKITEILGYIDPDLGYDDWVKVLMGLHDELHGSDEGLYLANEWSSRGQTYSSFEEIEHKWRSFSLKLGGITFATVAKMAEANGADLKEIASHYDKNGVRVRSYDELLEEAKVMTPGTHPDEIERFVIQTSGLSVTQCTRVRQMLRKTTSYKLGDMRAIDNYHKQSQVKTDHLGLANSVIEAIGSENILNANSSTWLWSGSGIWQIMEERAIRKLVQDHVKSLGVNVVKQLIDGVVDTVKTEVFKENQQFNIGESETVNCLNGEVLLDKNERWVLQAHCRENYCTTQIPVAYDAQATAPIFSQFMLDIFKGDEDAVEKTHALLEMMGYTLMAHCQHERFIILVGSGANGKSVLLHVLSALCGVDNIAGVQPSQFDRSFQRAHLHNKLANIVTEVKQGEIIDDASLKGIVSGEPTTVENKFKDPFVMWPFSTCWFGTNHLPHTRDFSDALFRRALIVQFNNVFKPELGNCDPTLKSKLINELPGILNLALNAYAAALNNGFTTPISCTKVREEWRLNADQVAQFVLDECETDLKGKETIRDLFSAYKYWAHENGIHRLLTMKSFSERLALNGFGKARSSNARYVTGLVLISPSSIGIHRL